MPAPGKGRSARWLLLAAALAGSALTARLGWWQLDRAAQKLALQARIEGRALLPPLPASALASEPAAVEVQQFRRITLRGRWLPRDTVYLDNRQMDGRVGFIVVTPLRLPGGDAVLVQRGFVPRNFEHRGALPPVPTAAGEVELSGRIAPPPALLFEFSGTDDGRIRQNLHLLAFSREIGVALRPLSVQQLGADRELAGPDDNAPSDRIGDGLLRHWPAAAVDVGMHHGYAFQWFALSALIAGLYVWFQLIRPHRH